MGLSARRNFTGLVDGWLREKQFSLMDRDVKFTTAFRSSLARAGAVREKDAAPSPAR